MGKKFFFVAAILVAALMLFGVAIAKSKKPKPKKVEICHIPPGNPDNFHSITVSENALQAHLDHGDVEGSCNESCDIVCDDGDACTDDEYYNCEEEGCDYPREEIVCDDGDLCTVDDCDPDFGCVYTPKVCPEGETCDSATGECEGGSPTPVKCKGATCGNLKVCNEGGSCTKDGINYGRCFASDGESGFCLDGSTYCWDVTTCDDSSDCPVGFPCIETCCPGSSYGTYVKKCAPPSIFCSEPGSAASMTTKTLRAPVDGRTIGGF